MSYMISLKLYITPPILMSLADIGEYSIQLSVQPYW